MKEEENFVAQTGAVVVLTDEKPARPLAYPHLSLPLRLRCIEVGERENQFVLVEGRKVVGLVVLFCSSSFKLNSLLA